MNILATALNRPRNETNLIGAPSFAQVNPYGLYGHFKADDYASAYPNIRSISNEYMKIRPYAINANGEPVDHPVINALYHPNKRDSSVMFAEKVAISTLALPLTYILVWRKEGGKAMPGGNYGFKGQNIAGFTFLENPSITYIDGKIHYSIGSQTFTEDEVMVLPGGATPDNLYAGYSPTLASKRWATLDSYIADFQKGFFENGAIPAGMFVIAAATETDFEDTKTTMQAKHRGAGNNNNVSYVPRPMGADGKPADAKVEWIPFAQSNREIDFKPLLEHVDNRLSEAYGVSSIIKGVDSNAKYSNAEVSENGFAKRAVDPLALRNYTQITHELNRITGGIGIAIMYHYDIPAISDQEKVLADTKKLEMDIILGMTDALIGYSLNSVVDAFGLSPRYKLLKKDNSKPVIDNDKPDVDEGDEVDDAPDPGLIDGVTPVNKGGSKGANPKAELTDEQKIEAVAREYMQEQVDRVVQEYKDEPVDIDSEPSADELDEFVDNMVVVVSSMLASAASEQHILGIALLEAAGIDTTDLTDFVLSEDTIDGYRAYVRRVGESYGTDTATSIRAILVESDSLGLTRAQTEKALKNIMNADDWRVKRLGITEVNRSQGIASVESMKQLQAQTGASIEKTLNHKGEPECEFCKASEDVWVPVDQPLLALGDSIIGVDGGILVNDFTDNVGFDYHPNGKGAPVYRVVES